LNARGGVPRKARNALGWSQSALAAKCQRRGWDVDRVPVAKIESRLRTVSDWEVLKWCEATGARPGELLGADPPPAAPAALAAHLKAGCKAGRNIPRNPCAR
jgi:hypothetical protein